MRDGRVSGVNRFVQPFEYSLIPQPEIGPGKGQRWDPGRAGEFSEFGEHQAGVFLTIEDSGNQTHAPWHQRVHPSPLTHLAKFGKPFVFFSQHEQGGVARQLVLAGVPLRSVRHVFITHHHSDHNADYGTLLLLSWSSGPKTRVDTWGPPPLARITKLFLEMSRPDLRVRELDEGKAPLPPLIHPHELSKEGPVMEDERIKVRCALMEHPLVRQSVAYRLETADRSIVISGDTAPSSNLVRLARGADILVHEVIYPPAIDAIAGLARARPRQRFRSDAHDP